MRGTAVKRAAVVFAVAAGIAAAAEGPTPKEIGVGAFWAGDLVTAELAFYEALIADGVDAEAYYYLGRICEARGSWERALEYFSAAAELGLGEAHFWAGSVYYRTGDYEAASSAYRRYLEEYPRDAAAWFNLGVAEEKAGRTAEAEGAYLGSLAANPRYGPPLFNLAVLYYKRGDYTRAAFFWRRYAEMEPGHAEAHYGLGLTLKAMGDLTGAAEAFLAASYLSPLDARVFFELGDIYYRLARYELAVGSYTRAYELGFDEGRVAEGLGLSYTAWKKYAEAWPLLTRAAEIRGKEGGMAYMAMGRIQREQGEYGAALASFFEAAGRLPEPAMAYNEIGEIYLKEDLPSWAIEPLRRATAGEPTSALYAFNLAVAYDRSEPRRAAAAWRRYLDLAAGRSDERDNVAFARRRVAELEAQYGREGGE